MPEQHQSKVFKSPAYLWQNRHGTYFFRARIPTDFQTHFGRTEFKRSLKTDSKREAIKIARAYRVELDKEMDKLKGKHNAYEVTLEAKIPHPTKQGEFITGKVTRSLLDPKEDTYRYKKQLVEQLRDESLFQAKLESISAQQEQSPAKPTKPTPLLSEVIKAYLDEGAALNRWKDRTQTQVETTINLLLKVVGDMPMHEFSKETARQFKQKYIKLPKNINKKPEYRDKSIDELLAMDIPKEHQQAHNNINNNLVRLSTFFKWAEDNGYSEKNYFAGLTLGKAKRASEERQAFTKEDLKRLFESTEYQKGFKEPHRHWVPLIGLYTGARLEEICRLRVENLKVMDGINIIEIAPDGEWKGKTGAAIRVIPIHPKLIEIGLLDFAESQKAKGHKRLFPELSKQRDGYSARVSKWFTRYKERCGITESGKVFHSFRHTLANELKQNRVELEIAKAILGHQDDSMTYGRYGKDYRPDVLFEAIRLIDFRLKVVKTF